MLFTLFIDVTHEKKETIFTLRRCRVGKKREFLGWYFREINININISLRNGPLMCDWKNVGANVEFVVKAALKNRREFEWNVVYDNGSQ